MIKKSLCFSNPAYLSLKLNQLVIKIANPVSGKDRVLTRPIEDIGMIIIESHSVVLTSALLAFLMENNVAVLTCDSKHMPSGLMLPLAYNNELTEKATRQINSSQPLKKQLWQQTVSAKISNQSLLLRQHCKEETSCMDIWAKGVRSGDPDNLEARAAVFYWRNLFPKEYNFMRGDEANSINSLLDYGYAILRAIVARALVSTGLIPTIGLFHSNKYNAYCLADDIMEPYRPFVDMVVLELIARYGKNCRISPEIKKELLRIPGMDVKMGIYKRPLMNAAAITCASLAKCYSGDLRKISYPVIE